MQDYPGRCRVCGAREHAKRPVEGFCWVHEPYQGAPAALVRRVKAAVTLERWSEEEQHMRERYAVRLEDARTDEAIALSEWKRPPPLFGHPARAEVAKLLERERKAEASGDKRAMLVISERLLMLLGNDEERELAELSRSLRWVQ